MLDLDTIKDLQTVPYEQSTLFNYLFNLFLVDSARLIDSIKSDFETKDLDALYKHTHELKGASWNIGAKSVGDLALEICISIKETPEEPLGEALREMYEEVNQVVSELFSFSESSEKS